MKMIIYIKSNVRKNMTIEYECDDSTLVYNFLKDIYIKYYESSNLGPSSEELIQHFNFIKGRNKQKAQLDYNLIDFLNNFGFDLKKIKMEYYGGIGGGFGLCGFADVRINNGEPHWTPHAHIYSYRGDGECVRIVLDTMTQMKGDRVSIDKLFNRKEKYIIFKFLRENQYSLIDMYERVNKGELIPYEYVLTLDGKNYAAYTNGKYEYYKG